MDLVADRYRVDSPIGRGRSTVYRGQDTVLGRKVALKQVSLAAGHEDDERTRTRARREAQAAARLNNPSVVEVFDIVEDDGSMWLVMELVDAPTLADVVRSRGPLDHRETAEVGLDVLGALEAAHAVGVVHRDVKPANVLVRPDLPAKLADFGVATIRGESRVTSTGLVVGSPAYMSPEQARGENAGPPADLWALGATLYFALEGMPPFEGDTLLATASAVVYGEPRPAQHPGPLTRIVDELLQKEPQDRPSVGEVRTALLAATRSTPPTVMADVTRVAPPTDLSGVPGYATRRGAPGRGRGWLAALALLAVLGVIGWLVWGGNGDDGGVDSSARGQATTAPSDASQTTAAPTPTTSTPATAPSTAAGSAPAPPASGAGIPAGWLTYQDPSGAYSIAYPPGWQVAAASGPRVDFRDPTTGSYLRVDWTDQPQPDPVADWQRQAPGFASRHDGYEEIGIAPYAYRDYNAALWELRYRRGDAVLHAANLGFVAGNKGYALYFQTPEQDWARSQDIYAGFRSAFQPG